MKKSSLSLLILLAMPVFAEVTAPKSNRLMRLTWTLNPPAEAVAFYTVRVAGLVQTKFTVSAPPVELTNILRDFPNGEYEITVTATGESAFESRPSAPLHLFWYGNTPSAPIDISVSLPQ